jgi:hypothetical protein
MRDGILTKLVLVSTTLAILFVMFGGCINPPTTNNIYINPRTQTKGIGEEFTVSIQCDAIDEIHGFETSLYFDQYKCQPVSWVWGSYFFLDSNFTGFHSMPVIDYLNGTITNIYAVSLMGGIKASRPMIHFTFMTTTSGNCEIQLFNTTITNATSSLPLNITNGSVTISQ